MRYAHLALLLLAAAQPAVAGLYKWVDEQGVTHYGDTIPPQYAGQGRSELDRSGMTVKRVPAALTPEQRKAKEEAALEQKRQQQEALERKRRDTALLDSYSNVGEIDLARDRNLQHEDALIQSTQLRLKAVQARLAGYRKREAALAKAGRPAPPDLAEDSAAAKRESDALGESLRRQQQEREAIRLRYEADKQRYRELTGGQAAR